MVKDSTEGCMGGGARIWRPGRARTAGRRQQAAEVAAADADAAGLAVAQSEVAIGQSHSGYDRPRPAKQRTSSARLAYCIAGAIARYFVQLYRRPQDFHIHSRRENVPARLKYRHTRARQDHYFILHARKAMQTPIAKSGETDRVSAWR